MLGNVVQNRLGVTVHPRIMREVVSHDRALRAISGRWHSGHTQSGCLPEATSDTCTNCSLRSAKGNFSGVLGLVGMALLRLQLPPSWVLRGSAAEGEGRDLRVSGIPEDRQVHG